MNSQTQRQALISDGLPSQLPDLDPAETQEWVEALDENKKLYERLLQSEREKVEMLQEVLRGKMTG